MIDCSAFHLYSFSTGIIVGLGDVVAQQAIERRSMREHDWKRTANVTLIGFAYIVSSLRLSLSHADGIQ